MSKYYKAEDVERLIENICNVMIGKEEPIETALCELPTIEMIDNDTREFCKRLHPTWDSGYAVGFNDGRKTERERIEVSEDCISREDTIKIIERIKTEVSDSKKLQPMPITICNWFLADIKNAPSVVPSRAEGEWIKEK